MRKKDSKKTTKLMGIFIVVIMAGSILGVIVYNLGEDKEEKLPDNAFKYEGYTFHETSDGFFGTFAMINGKETPVLFRADPRNLSDIYVTPDAVKRLLDSKKAYVSFNPNQEDLSKVGIAAFQISRLLNTLGIPTTGAYSEDADPVDENVPIRRCKDSLEQRPVIMLEIGEETRITSGDCIYVRGKDYAELILAADKLGMHLVGIKIGEENKTLQIQI